MNFHESEKISGILLNMGIERTLDKENADIIVFNTCCVRDSAERKIIGNIGSVKKLKLKRRNLLVIVCGCMTQQNGMASQLRSTFPFIDIIIGTHPHVVEPLETIYTEDKNFYKHFGFDFLRIGISSKYLSIFQR